MSVKTLTLAKFKYVKDEAGELIEHSGVSLNPPSTSTPLPAQMSKDWIEYVGNKLELAGKYEVSDLIQLNFNKIEKYLVAVDKVKGEVNFLKLNTY